jgi:hypothetical protein
MSALSSISFATTTHAIAILMHFIPRFLLLYRTSSVRRVTGSRGNPLHLLDLPLQPLDIPDCCLEQFHLDNNSPSEHRLVAAGPPWIGPSPLDLKKCSPLSPQ